MDLKDALPHLHHFCNTLGDVRYASSKPVYSFDTHMVDGTVMCKIVLPGYVDSTRRFQSSEYWPSETLAKADAAFEACIALHKEGLLNDNFLPIKHLSEGEASMYQIIEKRPNIVEVSSEYNPWPSIAKLSSDLNCFSQRYVVIKQDNGIQLRMRLIMPGMPKDIEDFKLYIDGHTTLHVSFEDLVAADSSSILNAMRFTKTMLYSIFGTRTDQNEPILPLLFLPDEQAKMDLLMSDHLTYDATKIFSTSVAFEDLGLIRDPAGVPYIFLDRTEMTLSDEQSGSHDKATKPMIKASRFPKRRDFLHPVSTYDQPRKNDGVLLDPDLCSIESLPLRYARFGTFIPSIQRQIRNSLLVERLNSTILTSARMSSMKLIMEAISSPAAHEASNYQRMEFLGDAVLKYYTAVTLMAQNLNYPEGYLANTKDLIVSNKSAALAAKEVGLDEFIIRTGFTAAKWRPIYMREIESVAPNIHKDDTAELSTKVLADVVEALIGAAYLDGGDTEAKVIAILDIFTCTGVRSEISWRPLAQMQQTLISAAPELKQLPSMVTHLQTMTGYTFKHPTLAVEALTHPNHISLSSGIATGTTSYQRLEFLGDAVLDMLVTRAIYSFKKSTSVFRMHLLRTAAVNQDILGYFALCLSTDLDTSELVNNKALLSRKRNKYSNMRDKPNKLPQKTVRSITLPQLLRHAPTPQLSLDLINMQKRCSELGDDLRNALETGIEYPWKLLASLAPEKLASDLIESVTGAIYIDSLGNLDACEAWIERVGILAWLRRALEEDVKVWHPKEELGVLAGTQKVKYLSSRQDEKDQTFVCTVIVGEKEICQAQGASKKIAETNAAATAIEILSRGEGYKVSRHPAMMDSEREEGDIELDI